MVIFSKSHSVYERLFHLFLLIIGISVGLVFALCFKLDGFNSPIFSVPFKIPKVSISFHDPSSLSPPPPPPPPLMAVDNTTTPVIETSDIVSNVTSYNETVIEDAPVMNNRTNSAMHNMSDEELLATAATYELDHVVPKVAFMFLTPGLLAQAPLWDRFFRGYEGMYSVYVHTHPDYNESVPEDSAFFGRRIPSQPVYWGTISMIDAERRLLANALLDKANQRFVLLSDSCIPLFNFTTIYSYLISAPHSYLSSYDDPRKVGRGRYNHRMWPNITIEQWRKSSQWFEIHRDIALKVVADQKYYKLFEEYCTPPCYSDEHYLPTLVNILAPEENSNKSITWVDWSRGGPHPRRFGWIDVKADLINWIKYGEECEHNGVKTNICYLFARKFIPNTLKPLMKVAPWLLGIQ